MNAPELKLKCLELAMIQAKCENLHADRNSVVEISAQFYNHIAGSEDAEPEPHPETGAAPERKKPGRKPRADKDPVFT